MNGEDVSQVDHGDIVNLIKSSGTSIKLTVQQPDGKIHGLGVWPFIIDTNNNHFGKLACLS